MTSREFLEQNPKISRLELVHEVIEWRDRANKYKSLFHTEAEAHAKTRSQLQEIVYDKRQGNAKNS